MYGTKLSASLLVSSSASSPTRHQRCRKTNSQIKKVALDFNYVFLAKNGGLSPLLPMAMLRANQFPQERNQTVESINYYYLLYEWKTPALSLSPYPAVAE